MKEFIGYYYGIKIDNIVKNIDKYFFEYAGKKYMLKKCDNLDIDMYYKELLYQLSNYSFFFSIVLNRVGKVITVINGNNYVLLQLSNIINDNICIFDIRIDLFLNNCSELSRICYYPWVKLWETKIDYFENYFVAKKNYYFDNFWLYEYIIGMGELAIAYFKDTECNEIKDMCDNLTIQHLRINTGTKMYDYYDPTDIIIDHSSRDLCEYIKNSDNSNFDIEVLAEFLERYELSRYWIRIFYSRMLFPSNLFDSIEHLISNKENESIINNTLENQIIKNLNLIAIIGAYLKNRYNIPIVEFNIK